ncbi:hypothetical protein ABFS83_11G065500 [Erythranthe nasuta]
MIPALMFLTTAKSVESLLTQTQWYFGASRIGITLRAALMALIDIQKIYVH